MMEEGISLENAPTDSTEKNTEPRLKRFVSTLLHLHTQRPMRHHGISLQAESSQTEGQITFSQRLDQGIEDLTKPRLLQEMQDAKLAQQQEEKRQAAITEYLHTLSSDASESVKSATSEKLIPPTDERSLDTKRPRGLIRILFGFLRRGSK